MSDEINTTEYAEARALVAQLADGGDRLSIVEAPDFDWVKPLLLRMLILH